MAFPISLSDIDAEYIGVVWTARNEKRGSPDKKMLDRLIEDEQDKGEVFPVSIALTSPLSSKILIPSKRSKGGVLSLLISL